MKQTVPWAITGLLVTVTLLLIAVIAKTDRATLYSGHRVLSVPESVRELLKPHGLLAVYGRRRAHIDVNDTWDY